MDTGMKLSIYRYDHDWPKSSKNQPTSTKRRYKMIWPLKRGSFVRSTIKFWHILRTKSIWQGSRGRSRKKKGQASGHVWRIYPTVSKPRSNTHNARLPRPTTMPVPSLARASWCSPARPTTCTSCRSCTPNYGTPLDAQAFAPYRATRCMDALSPTRPQSPSTCVPTTAIRLRNNDHHPPTCPPTLHTAYITCLMFLIAHYGCSCGGLGQFRHVLWTNPKF